MNQCSVTLTFASIDEAQAALAAVLKATGGGIAYVDRPDVGADPAPAPTPPLFNPFAAGAAVAQVPPPAPCTAAAEAPPTAPAAPPATSPAPPSAAVPPAPPIASAAAAPAVPAAPTNPAGIEVDADGLPWDARIHSGGGKGERPKNADGRWRQKRGLNDPALKARVEAELRQAMGAPAAASVPAAPTPPAPPATATVAPTVVPAPPATTVPSPTVAAAPDVVPAVPAPPAAAPAETFPAFMARVGGLLVAGSLTQEALNAALAEVGLSSMAQVALRPDLMPALSARLA